MGTPIGVAGRRGGRPAARAHRFAFLATLPSETGHRRTRTRDGRLSGTRALWISPELGGDRDGNTRSAGRPNHAMQAKRPIICRGDAGAFAPSSPGILTAKRGCPDGLHRWGSPLQFFVDLPGTSHRRGALFSGLSQLHPSAT